MSDVPDPRLEAVRPAARRILSLMFFGGVSEAVAANMESLNTPEWQRALAYARAALGVPA